MRKAHPDEGQPNTGGGVRLDGKMVGKWAETLKKHWQE
jgi:hypothetical protein